MEENKIEIVKPEFTGEIQAKIKSLGEIEDNISDVKSYVENLNNYYKNVIFTEETLSQAKDEKSKVNKFKKEVSDYRKNIISEYNKPIKQFESTAKETEKLLSDTYDTINSQVAEYENRKKQEKEQKIKDYFEEYKQSLNIDFVEYGQANINITLTATETSLKKQAKEFIDKINTDIATIMLQEHKEEILVEYKQNGFNLNIAIIEVSNRIKAIEEQKMKQLENQQKIVDESIKEQTEITKQAIDNFNINKTEEKIQVSNEKIHTITFTVTGTAVKLKQLKQYLLDGGYQYE